jgi:hypothetical protein
MATTTDYRETAPTRSAANENADGIVGLLKELRDETGTLLRQEVALAKTEITEKAATFGRNGAYLGAGAAVAMLGAFFLLLGLTNLLAVGLNAAGLSEETAAWLAPLIVGAAIVAVGYAFVQKAISTFRHESVVPEKTVDSIKENKEWLQRKVS